MLYESRSKISNDVAVNKSSSTFSFFQPPRTLIKQVSTYIFSSVFFSIIGVLLSRFPSMFFSTSNIFICSKFLKMLPLSAIGQQVMSWRSAKHLHSSWIGSCNDLNVNMPIDGSHVAVAEESGSHLPLPAGLLHLWTCLKLLFLKQKYFTKMTKFKFNGNLNFQNNLKLVK